ncbi:MAG: hypothetical protein U0167_15450 [bacterium]
MSPNARLRAKAILAERERWWRERTWCGCHRDPAKERRLRDQAAPFVEDAIAASRRKPRG